MILFADTFNTYGSDASLMLNGLYGSVGANLSLDPDPNAPVGTRVLSLSGFGNNIRRPFLTGPVATAGCAIRLWMDALPYFTTACIRFFDILNTLETNMVILPNGAIAVYKGVIDHGGVLLGQTSVPVLTANTYNHIEMKVVASTDVSATGAFEVRINGVTVLSAVSVITGQAAQIGLGTTNDYNNTDSRHDYIKDLVVWDGTGTYNKDFLGSVSVIDLLPDSDVAFSWSPSSGTTGFNLINAIPPVDTSYVQANFPLPAASVFGLQNLPADVTSVKAVIPTVRAEKIDGGDGNLQMAMKSGASTGLGSDRPMTVAFTYWQDVFEVDPATSAPWLPAAVNAANLQLNRTV